MFENITDEFLDFLSISPSCYHVVSNFRKALLYAGYEELQENHPAQIKAGGKYFIVRNESSIIAFRIPQKIHHGFMIAAAHSDSPSFKIKANPEIVENGYVKLNTEKYGGMIYAPWLDRPLSVAGRVITKEKTEKGVRLTTHLVNVDRDLLVIPNVAIHMNREMNKNLSYNEQTDLLPLFGDAQAAGTFLPLVARYAGVDPEDIVSHDLFLYPHGRGSLIGSHEEFILAPHIDDLQCAYSIFRGFLASDSKEQTKGAIPVCAVFDNEEVGSLTKQGANSTFLHDVLSFLCDSLRVSLPVMAADSMMLSADNSHALHPNHPEKADPVNRPAMNQGVVIKYSANQKYTTDAVSAALFREICDRAGVPCQEYNNRSDIAGGSTLGNIANAHVSLNTVDIGLAQLAMHSCMETAGSRDTAYMALAARCFYRSILHAGQYGSYSLQYAEDMQLA